MNDDLNVFLIENQITQYRKIKKFLNDDGHTVYPECDITFKDVIDKVRVYLNPRFGGIQPNSTRAQVFESILSLINNTPIDILLVDYILVGCHKGKNGIFLANKFREEGIDKPIVFISREKRNEYEIKNALSEELQPYIWCHKGYAGKMILDDEDYFKKHVIEKFEPLIGKKEFLIYSEKIQNILKLKIFDTDADNLKAGVQNCLKTILQNKVINKDQKEIIDEFTQMDNHDESTRYNFYNDLKGALNTNTVR